MQGAFDAACRAIRCTIAVGIGVQVNTTVTRHNAAELPAVLDLAVQLGGRTLDLFFLVPTGRGALLKDLSLDAAEYEKVLAWVADTAPNAPLRLKTTCAPQYARIVRQRGGDNPRAPFSKGDRNAAHTAGCMAGRGFLFISHTGILHPCGFLPVPCGDLRSLRFDVRTAIESSATLESLRTVDSFHGSCGVCEYRIECGGCRARAFALSGDMLGAEPFCRHAPRQSTAQTGRS